VTTFTTTHANSLPFKGRAGEGMVFESPFHLSRNTIPTQTLPLKGRASKQAARSALFSGGAQ
jgi:hypothetical protein